jgi:hypothetical protein
MHRVALLALVAVAVACDGGGGGDGGVRDGFVSGDSPVGTWSRNGALFACFKEDHRAAFGDTPEEVTMPFMLSGWDQSGKIYFWNSGGTGTWQVAFDSLYLTIDPPCSENCGPFRYERDASFDCFP